MKVLRHERLADGTFQTTIMNPEYVKDWILLEGGRLFNLNIKNEKSVELNTSEQDVADGNSGCFYEAVLQWIWSQVLERYVMAYPIGYRYRKCAAVVGGYAVVGIEDYCYRRYSVREPRKLRKAGGA